MQIPVSRRHKISKITFPYAAGALFSTVEDMYRWDRALYTGALVPQALLERMFKPYVGSPLGDFGYGWIVTDKHNRPVVRHGGGGDGFITVVERYPEDRAAIIVLSNRETTDLGAIVDEIGRLLFRH